jgi:predicted phage tail protein
MPGAPTNLQVSVVGTNRTFTWNAVANVTDYFIQIGTESGRSDVLFTNTSQTTYSWNGTALGNYVARVHAKNACGTSGNSNEVAFH